KAVESAPLSGGLGLSLIGPVAIAILVAAGVAFAMGRTRRTGEKALQNLLLTSAIPKDLGSLPMPELGVQPLFGSPSPPTGEDPSESSDNPLVPVDWLR
ncbi:MAG TPA: hypothetical protein VI818_01610, partial [Candidatus Thermoplasmatota archaeon]|nr:hypothetical protein [Candidatus Thermoplasmatota archaeon]